MPRSNFHHQFDIFFQINAETVKIFKKQLRAQIVSENCKQKT